MGGQACDQGFQVQLQLGVVVTAYLATERHQPGATEFILLLRGDQRRTGVSQRRQADVGGRGEANAQHQQQTEQRGERERAMG